LVEWLSLRTLPKYPFKQFPADIQIGNIDVPMLLRLRWLPEFLSFTRGFSLAGSHQSGYF
jgi:hypothetical protein